MGGWRVGVLDGIKAILSPDGTTRARAKMEKCNFMHFYILRKYENMWTFSTPKIRLADENQLIPCLVVLW